MWGNDENGIVVGLRNPLPCAVRRLGEGCMCGCDAYAAYLLPMVSSEEATVFLVGVWWCFPICEICSQVRVFADRGGFRGVVKE